MRFFFLSVLLLGTGYYLKHTLPFAAGLSFLLLLAFEFLRFLFLLRREASALGCPSFPRRLSDRQDLAFQSPSSRSGIRSFYRAELRWEGCRKQRLSSPPVGTRLSRPRRGRYSLIAQELVLEDFCGFFRQHRPGAAGQSVLIYPGATDAPYPSFPENTRIPEREVLYTSLKNQDYFESRPYYPGDDPRRINWKMMARHGELFIREGSGRLPSRSRVFLLVDPGEDDLSFGYLRASASPGDELLGLGASLIGNLRREGCRIDLAGPGSLFMEELESLGEEALEDLLALVPPRKLRGTDLPETLKPADIVFFLCAGGPDGDIMKRFAPVEQRILILPYREGAPKDRRKDKGIRRSRFSRIRPHLKSTREAIMEEGWTVVNP